MSLPVEEAAKFKIEVENDLQLYSQQVGKEDEFGLFTLDRLEWYLTMNLVGARYPEEDVVTHGERVKIFKEITGIQVDWDVTEERLIYPQNLEVIATKMRNS